MTRIIIADNLVNDYCGIEPTHLKKNVNIGIDQISRLMGSGNDIGTGAIPTFLNYQKKTGASLIFIRDKYDNQSDIHIDHFERFGEHCLTKNHGCEFPDYIRPITEGCDIINGKGLSFSLQEIRSVIKKNSGFDVFDEMQNERKNEVKFLIIGFHTERRIYTIANILRNLFDFPNVAVFSHLVAGFTRDAHFANLRYSFPDCLVKVLNGIDELNNYFDQDLDFLSEHSLNAVVVEPEEIQKQLSFDQKKIVKSICMHWTNAKLKPLSGGFSGSALFLAQGKQGNADTEPMVIKIDQHEPIRNEIRGYHLVKDFLGKHIPTFTFPVSSGSFSGIGMELASMEGAPMTLQDQFENSTNDYELDNFLKLFDNTLSLLTKRVYKNTYINRRIAPFRHFMLHIALQPTWLNENIENIFRHKTKEVIVSKDMLLNIFNLIRKNPDAINSRSCIGHGDLNLANIIVDNHGNLWTIDWTHADYHPIEIDFAKMENDIKFVIVKEFDFNDLPKLKILEEYFLNKMIPDDIDQLPKSLNFIKWDIRFKKIYSAVKKLRMYYAELKGDDDWVIYKISLLRYALHTLSFDKTIDQGECTPPQLWYALLSVESLCFQLVADDYHLKIRSERPEGYPERLRIPMDEANWKLKIKDYNPPKFDQPKTMNATFPPDTSENWKLEPVADWSTEINRNEKGLPLNPRGRTGITGRGHLKYWGSNPVLFMLPLRFNYKEEQLEILFNNKGEEIELIHSYLERNQDHSLSFENLKSMTGDKNIDQIHEVRTGFLYDYRQTDNAWVEAKSFLTIFDNKQKSVKGDLIWKQVDPHFINSLDSGHSSVLRDSIQYIYDQGIATDAFILKILDKTG